MCKLCDENPFDSVSVKENDAPYCDIVIDCCGDSMTIIGRGDNDAYYTPKYCPECGRKLEGNE